MSERRRPADASRSSAFREGELINLRRTGLLLTALSAFAGGTAAAQSPAEIVDAMLSEYEARIAGVENYTMVQVVMGFESLTYYEKEMSGDGRPVFRTRTAAIAGEQGSPATGMDDVYALGEDLANRSEYFGRESLNDVEVPVLDIADLRGTGFGSNVAQDSEFEPTRGRVYLDTETYVPRRLIFEGEMNRDGSTLPLTATIDMGDYRELQGLLIPYRTVTTIDGLAAAIDPEVRAQFEQMRRELENMPAQQRQMIESMMADQMKQFEAMMTDDGAPMVIEVVVRDVRVNEGSPN